MAVDDLLYKICKQTHLQTQSCTSLYTCTYHLRLIETDSRLLLVLTKYFNFNAKISYYLYKTLSHQSFSLSIWIYFQFVYLFNNFRLYFDNISNKLNQPKLRVKWNLDIRLCFRVDTSLRGVFRTQEISTMEHFCKNS